MTDKTSTWEHQLHNSTTSRPRSAKGFITVQIGRGDQEEEVEAGLASSSSASSTTRPAVLHYSFHTMNSGSASSSAVKDSEQQRVLLVAVHMPDSWLTSKVDVDVSTLSVDTTGRRPWSCTEDFCLFISKLAMLKNKDIVVLGSGLGLEGLVVGKAWPNASVLITDGNPELVPWISKNIEANDLTSNSKGALLRWGNNEDLQSALQLMGPRFHCNIVLGTEVLYSHAHIAPLVQCVSSLLAAGGVFIMAEVIRDPKVSLSFHEAAHRAGWSLVTAAHDPLQETHEDDDTALLRATRVWTVSPKAL